ncbi:hypothetical protein V3C99_002050 [Haemonchus contortus]
MVDWTDIALWSAICCFVIYFFKLFRRKKKKAMEIRKHGWEPDTVYLYQIPRARTTPHVSPQCLKVETFLKANNIPYEVCPIPPARSQHDLLPFIGLNGEHIADSQIIIKRLKSHFKVKSLLSPKDEAIARTIERTAENHTLLLMRQVKVIEDTNNMFLKMLIQKLGCPDAFLPALTPFVTRIMKQKVRKVITTSIGELSVEEYKELLRNDLDTYRDLLGKNQYFFGSNMSSADCTVFSLLASILYGPSDTYAKEVLQKQYPRLVSYCNHIRDTFYGKDFSKG